MHDDTATLQEQQRAFAAHIRDPAHNAAPDDIEEASGADLDPLVVAGVAVENGSTAYAYRAAFLPSGGYTVAFTCGDDDATADDTLTFIGAQDVTVQANLISTADFAVPAS